MADQEILDRIQQLVEEEHALGDSDATDTAERRAHLEETLDQCWDLLRQRRALREFGEDPEGSRVRGVDTVEHYKQ
jgi:DNA-binding transcriptional regulator PaaX